MVTMNVIDLLKRLVGAEVVVDWYSGGIAGAVNPNHYSTRGTVLAVDDTLLMMTIIDKPADDRAETFRDFKYLTINLEDCVVYAVDTLTDPTEHLGGNKR